MNYNEDKCSHLLIQHLSIKSGNNTSHSPFALLHKSGEWKVERLLERNWGINKTKTQQKQHRPAKWENGKNGRKKQLEGKKLAMLRRRWVERVYCVLRSTSQLIYMCIVLCIIYISAFIFICICGCTDFHILLCVYVCMCIRAGIEFCPI